MRANVNMMERMNEIVNKIKYKDWDIGFYADGSYIQLRFLAPCNEIGGIHEIQKSRKWLISEHMTDSEIVQTVFLAVKIAEEHEIREKFTFEGQTIFGPHFDVHELVDLIENGLINDDKRRGLWPPLS